MSNKYFSVVPSEKRPKSKSSKLLNERSKSVSVSEAIGGNTKGIYRAVLNMPSPMGHYSEVLGVPSNALDADFLGYIIWSPIYNEGPGEDAIGVRGIFPDPIPDLGRLAAFMQVMPFVRATLNPMTESQQQPLAVVMIDDGEGNYVGVDIMFPGGELITFEVQVEIIVPRRGQSCRLVKARTDTAGTRLVIETDIPTHYIDLDLMGWEGGVPSFDVEPEEPGEYEPDFNIMAVVWSPVPMTEFDIDLPEIGMGEDYTLPRELEYMVSAYMTLSREFGVGGMYSYFGEEFETIPTETVNRNVVPVRNFIGEAPTLVSAHVAADGESILLGFDMDMRTPGEDAHLALMVMSGGIWLEADDLRYALRGPGTDLGYAPRGPGIDPRYMVLSGFGSPILSTDVITIDRPAEIIYDHRLAGRQGGLLGIIDGLEVVNESEITP